MLTRSDLLEQPITVEDMQEFVQSERMPEVYEHRQTMYDNGLWAGPMSIKEAIESYAEYLMGTVNGVYECEEWLLNR